MSDSAVLGEAIVIETISQIEQAKDDPQKCWDITLQSADTLHFYNQQSIDDLIQLLLNHNRKVVVLSMLFLGMLNDMGLNATEAIEPIRQAAAHQPSHIIVVTTGIALAMLGHPDAVQAMATFMKKIQFPTYVNSIEEALLQLSGILQQGKNLVSHP